MQWVLKGIVAGKPVVQPLGQGLHLIGRGEESALKLNEPSVSRRHAEITVGRDGIAVRDLGSHNGTRVNGAAVRDQSVVLQPGDALEIAHLSFTVEKAGGAANLGLTMLDESRTLVPNAELSWDEFQADRSTRGQGGREHGGRGQEGPDQNARDQDARDQDARHPSLDRQSHLFRVLAEAGTLLTIPRRPAELFDPILDLVESAMDPERAYLLLLEGEATEPAVKASRVKGTGATGGLVLSRTMMRQVLEQKKSFLTSDLLNNLDGPDAGMMSMISLGIRSAIAVPLFDNEAVIGLLYADDSRGGKRFDRDDLSAFTLLANVIAVAITRARFHTLQEQKRLQDAELQAAAEILRNIIPSGLPPCRGFQASARIEPCFEVGGDLYDAHVMDDGRYVFLVGDVAGKGIGAALLVAHILSWVRFMLEEGWEPLALVRRLNRQIHRITDSLRFATFFIGYLEPDSGRVEYVNAGHNPPLVIRRDGALQKCPSTGMPVGILEEAPYRAGELILAPGDVLALYSDGIPETQRIDDEGEYGEERFEDFLRREKDGDLEGAFGRLQAELAAYRGDAPVGDDVTLMLLRRASG